MNEDVRSLMHEIIMHLNDIQRLKTEMFRRYGIRIISCNADWGEPFFQVKNGFLELKEYLGETSDIKGFKNHWNYYYGNVEICTVTNYGKRFLKAARRNNKWTNNGGMNHG